MMNAATDTTDVETPEVPETPIPDPESLTQAVNPDDSVLLNWLLAVGFLAVGFVLAALARRAIGRLFRRSQADTDHVEKLVSRLVQGLIIAVALVYALGAIGVRITPLLGALGIGGLALALAVQPALLNLFSGMIIHAQRPLRVGEEVKTGDIEGRVLDVTSRAVVIRTYRGETVYVPNSVVVDREIINLVRAGQRRSTMVVGVAYGTNLGLARRVITEAASSAEGVADTPGVEVFAREFADSSINFEVDVWHGAEEAMLRRTRANVIEAVNDALLAADITIPFPQRTLWFGAAEADSSN